MHTVTNSRATKAFLLACLPLCLLICSYLAKHCRHFASQPSWPHTWRNLEILSIWPSGTRWFQNAHGVKRQQLERASKVRLLVGCHKTICPLHDGHSLLGQRLLWRIGFTNLELIKRKPGQQCHLIWLIRGVGGARCFCSLRPAGLLIHALENTTSRFASLLSRIGIQSASSIRGPIAVSRQLI